MQAQATDAASAPSDEGAAPGPRLIDGKAIAAGAEKKSETKNAEQQT